MLVELLYIMLVELLYIIPSSLLRRSQINICDKDADVTSP